MLPFVSILTSIYGRSVFVFIRPIISVLYFKKVKNKFYSRYIDATNLDCCSFSAVVAFQAIQIG